MKIILDLDTEQLARLYMFAIDQAWAEVANQLSECSKTDPVAAQKFRDAVPVRDGEIEVDDGAVVSVSDEGAYVSCWVWVPNEAAGFESEESED